MTKRASCRSCGHTVPTSPALIGFKRKPKQYRDEFTCHSCHSRLKKEVKPRGSAAKKP